MGGVFGLKLLCMHCCRLNSSNVGKRDLGEFGGLATMGGLLPLGQFTAY